MQTRLAPFTNVPNRAEGISIVTQPCPQPELNYEIITFREMVMEKK